MRLEYIAKTSLTAEMRAPHSCACNYGAAVKAIPLEAPTSCTLAIIALAECFRARL
jgi:hypothetical protein